MVEDYFLFRDRRISAIFSTRSNGKKRRPPSRECLRWTWSPSWRAMGTESCICPTQRGSESDGYYHHKFRCNSSARLQSNSQDNFLDRLGIFEVKLSLQSLFPSNIAGSIHARKVFLWFKKEKNYMYVFLVRSHCHTSQKIIWLKSYETFSDLCRSRPIWVVFLHIQECLISNLHFVFFHACNWWT